MADIRLTDQHDLDFTTAQFRVEGTDEIVQHLRLVMRLVRGEFFTATTRGVPIFDVLGKTGIDDVGLENLLRDVATTVPGVTDVTNIVVTRDTTNRVLSATVDVTSNNGETLTVGI